MGSEQNTTPFYKTKIESLKQNLYRSYGTSKHGVSSPNGINSVATNH